MTVSSLIHKTADDLSKAIRERLEDAVETMIFLRPRDGKYVLLLHDPNEEDADKGIVLSTFDRQHDAAVEMDDIVRLMRQHLRRVL